MISSDMLMAFTKVAENLSVSKAALALSVGKSVVSKRIAQLETHLGATLFSRSTRHIALTAAGETYLEHAQQALLELSAGEERLTALRSDLRGRIRVTAPVSWGQRILCKKMPEFLRMHPGIELELVLSDRMMDLAYERMDVAFRWSSLQDSKELFMKSVSTIDWVLVCAPQYIAAHGEPSSPQELEEHLCLFYWREPSDDWWVLKSGDQVSRVKVSGRYHVDSPDAVLEACLQGLGIALLPDYLCADAIGDQRLLKVLPQWIPQTRFGNQITLMSPPDRMRVRRKEVFIDFVVNALV
ncbi:LysR family transcriptional regulator [Limnohabitans sp. Rim8]|uniref:LysR family transcriptional regulator n=1 Tax=Limnohabitans sp. Rim8 TaxID=1100718 RepID=UPI00263412AD|nr:LysR family transcriptional regulator [Limnohabitans sp. Rim8]